MTFSIIDRFKIVLRHAFAVESTDKELAKEDKALIDRLAKFIVRRGLTVPGVMLLESLRPLNFIGSQVLAFLLPFATLVFSEKEYKRIVDLMQRRQSVTHLIDAIARIENQVVDNE